jgi:hypothetical protein
MNELPEHVRKNREWSDHLARDYAAAGERAWAMDKPVRGIWHTPEPRSACFRQVWPRKKP